MAEITPETEQASTTVVDTTAAETTTEQTQTETTTPSGENASTETTTEQTQTESTTPSGKNTSTEATPDQNPETEQSKPQGKPKVVETPDPHYVGFFKQYLELIGKRQPDQAIKAYNNSIKSMLQANTNEAFNTMLKLFKTNKQILTTDVVLQSVSILPSNERATLEIVTTIFHVMVNNPKAEINLDMARSVIKKDPFINWCAKKISK